MFNRYGCYLAALGGLASFFVLVAAAPVPAPQQPQSTKAAPAATSADSNRGQGITAFERETLILDRAANRSAERANDIAEAQKSYGFWQLILGVAGVLFTGIAAVAATAAALYARKAASQAKRSADADNDALRVTTEGVVDARRASEAQLSAYFSLINFEYTLPTDEDSQPTYTLQIVNCGQTPARAFRQLYDCFIADKEMSFTPISPGLLAGLSKGHIGPTQPISINGRLIEASRADVEAVLRGEKWVYLTGAIEFTNINNRSYRVDFGRHSKRDLREGRNEKMAYFSSSWHWEERDISQGNVRQDS